MYRYKIVEKVTKRVLHSGIRTREDARNEKRIWKSEGFKVDIVQRLYQYQLLNDKIIR